MQRPGLTPWWHPAGSCARVGGTPARVPTQFPTLILRPRGVPLPCGLDSSRPGRPRPDRCAAAAPPRFGQNRRYVARKSRLENAQSRHDVVASCAACNARAIDEQRLRIGALQLDRRQDQALDRVGHVVRLVEHVGGIERPAPALGRVDQLVEDPEKPERIDRAGIQIVVAVFRIVEMESAELADTDQPRHDLLDIDVRRVMAEIDQANAFGPSACAAIRLIPQSEMTVE